MTPPVEPAQRVVVEPRLSGHEIDFLTGFAPVESLAPLTVGVRRLWPGQPGVHSPWLPCADGCCLHLQDATARVDASGWLRFLIRELLAPRASGAVLRARRQDLPGGHRLDGRVVLGVGEGRAGPRLVVVVNNRVREQLLDDDLFPVGQPGRPGRLGGPAPVVDLDSRRRAQSTER